MKAIRNVYKTIYGIYERKRLRGGSRPRFEESIKVDVTDTGCWDVGQTELAQDRVQWSGNETPGSIKDIRT
jgi:hypothetical protein